MKRALALAVLLLTAACGGADAKSYKTIDELRNDAIKAGIDCSQYFALPGAPVVGGLRSASCSEDSSLMLFRDQPEVQHFLDIEKGRTQSLPGYQSRLLVGPNWTIRSPQIDDLQGKMGGKVYEFK